MSEPEVRRDTQARLLSLAGPHITHWLPDNRILFASEVAGETVCKILALDVDAGGVLLLDRIVSRVDSR